MVDVFSNKKLLTNINDTIRNLILHCNAGKAIISNKGDLMGYGTVWFYPDGIPKIRVTYNSTLGEGFLVFKADGTTQ